MRALVFPVLIAGGLFMGYEGVAADIAYPAAKRTEQTDLYHGVKVADPYRWLEDDVRKSDEVKAWVEAENKVTNAYLQAIPQREGIQKRLTELWNYEKYTAPVKVGGRYFYRKNDGLQNQAVLYVMEKLDGEPRVLIDPNTWSKDGTIALGATVLGYKARTASTSPTPCQRAARIGRPGRSWTSPPARRSAMSSSG